MTNKQYFTKKEVYENVLTWLYDDIHFEQIEKNSLGEEIDEHSMHHDLFNTDYYIIGTYEAKQALEEYGVYEAVEEIKNYEMFHFNEVTTELGVPEKVANMLWYIIGERVINEMEFYSYDTVSDVIRYLEKQLQEM